ncbi:MAG: hypothetical protein K6E37_01670 [Bacteroidales bacterium]|nr:hypothetical protein [Bacteroidales bacterium]
MASFFRKALDVLETIITIPFFPILFLIGLFLPDKANSIVILGTKYSGKTTLWKELGGIEEVRPNTNWEPVQSFEINRSNGTKVKISETADIGGEDWAVGDYYGRLIKEDTFIYYLVDSNDVSLSSKMQRVRSDLIKIDKIVKEKGIKERIGFKFILTHFYDYTKTHPNSNEYDLYRLFLKALDKSKGRGVIGSKLGNDKISEVMMVAELDEEKAKKLGKDYIGIIRNEIGK